MLQFLAVLLAALIAAILSPYFSQFLHKQKNKDDTTLKYLEEAYLLASQLEEYANQTISNMLFSISAAKKQIKFEDVPKIKDEPFSKLSVLLDFHLNAPQELKDCIYNLKNILMLSFRSFAKAVNSHNNEEKDKLFSEAINECIDAAKQALPIQNDTIKWIKSGRDILQQKSTFFEKEYWKKLYVSTKQLVDG